MGYSKKWNQSTGKATTGAKKSPSIMRGAFAALAVVVGVAAVWMLLKGSGEPEPAEPKQPTRITTPVSSNGGQRAARPTDGGGQSGPAIDDDVVGRGDPTAPDDEKKPGVFAPGMIRLPNGFELRFKLPAEGETRQLLAGGEIWEIDSKGEIQNVTPPPVFEKPFEGMISSLYERDGMVLPFALKRYSEEEVRKMCKEPTLSYDDDTPEITVKRENVAMLKQAILEFLDGGGTFEEFVDDMQQHSQNAQRAQVEGMHGVRDLLQAGKDDEALQYYRLFAQDMADKGYGELKLPPSYREALEEIAAKEKNSK